MKKILFVAGIAILFCACQKEKFHRNGPAQLEEYMLQVIGNNIPIGDIGESRVYFAKTERHRNIPEVLSMNINLARSPFQTTMGIRLSGNI